MNIEKFTQNAQQAIMDCQNIAISEGHQMLDGEHLHLALLKQDQGLIGRLMEYMQMPKQAMINDVQAEIEKLQGEGKLAGITVLDPVIEGSADVTESTDVNASIIQANPDLIAAVSWTGNGPVTWSNAARKAGKAAGDLLIVSMDYTADNLVELESGYVSALVAQPLYQEAYQAVYDFDTLLRGGEVPYWTLLDAPLMYKGGEGEHDPAYYQDILDRVSTTFGN